MVSIARLDFPQAGLHCEGAGMAEAEVPSIEQRAKVIEKGNVQCAFNLCFFLEGDGKRGKKSSRGSSGCRLGQSCSGHSG